MKLVSWNVNGIRACMNKGFREFFDRIDSDIFCVQETKMQEGQMPLEIPGYQYFLSSAIKKGYSGTLVYTKIPPQTVIYGIDGKYTDEGRVITLEFEKFFLVNCYSPNSQDELKRIGYRMVYEEDLKSYLLRLNQQKPVILCGDLNVAHEPIDLKNPLQNEHNPGYSLEERTKMTALLASGFVDTYRYLYPEKVQYSWWSYRFQSRIKNIGWRIDYFIISRSLCPVLEDSQILTEVLGSDHCPILLQMNL